ncbi:MAG: sulfite exporter TauE/SafE family protein [Deltaproteobacteria bacterium]|nr:sulfite exporter TauE/SafE family protein [Deltaproteobacteria bacterium]
MTILLALVALIVGLLIGATGIGGILLIPAITALTGIGAHAAMATTLVTQFFSAIVGLFLHRRLGNVDWRMAMPICLGAVLFGYLGALVNSLAKASSLNLILSLIIIFSGVYTLRPSRRAGKFSFDKSSIAHNSLLLGIGASVGFVSGLTGVGGPVLSIPLMIIIGFSPLTSIGVSQALQITAAGSGTIGNLLHGAIDFYLAAWISVILIFGLIVGIWIAHRCNTSQLRLTIALTCLLVGGLVFYRSLA